MSGQNADNIRLDILNALQQKFGQGKVVPEKIWSPHQRNLRTANFIIEADKGGWFNISPHAGVKVAGYICSVNGGYGNIKIVDSRHADGVVVIGKEVNKVGVEVNIAAWSEVAAGEIAATVNRIRKGYREPVAPKVVEPPKPVVVEPKASKGKPLAHLIKGAGNEQNYKKLMMLVDELSNEGAETGFFDYCTSTYDRQVAVTLTYNKPEGYFDFILPKEFYRPFYKREGIDYTIVKWGALEPDYSYYDIRIVFKDSYLCANNITDLARKIDSDVRAIMNEVDVASNQKLYEHLAKKFHVKLEPFDDGLAKRLIEGGEHFSRYESEWRLFTTEGELAADLNNRNPGYPFVMQSIVGYWPSHQVFRMFSETPHFISAAEWESVSKVVEKVAQEALDLGFIVFGGSQHLLLFMKPIGGNFDYEKTFPQLCDILTYELGLLYNGKDLHDKIERYKEEDAKEAAKKAAKGSSR